MFLKNRKIQIRALPELSKIHQTENDLLQGSVISITMFLLPINYTFKNIPKPRRHLLFRKYFYTFSPYMACQHEITQHSLQISYIITITAHLPNLYHGQKNILKILDPTHNEEIRLSTAAFRISLNVSIIC